MARILVVDDNESDRLLLKTVLEGEGHAVLFSLAKPIDPQKLLSAVSKAVRSRQQDLWNRGKRT